MKNKELIKRLEKYKNVINLLMEAKLPKKHLHREKQYRRYLENELMSVNDKLDEAKLEA